MESAEGRQTNVTTDMETLSDRDNLALGSSQDRPAPMGVTVKTKIERGDRYSAPEVYHLEVTLLEFVRGKDAWERIKAEGLSDRPPEAGFEYILARIRVGYYCKARGFKRAGEAYRIAAGQFVAVSPDGKTEYHVPTLQRQPQQELIEIPFSPGDSREGWVVLQAEENAEKPLLIFHREYAENVYGVWGPVWFQLY
jgi:hypothetical protein